MKLSRFLVVPGLVASMLASGSAFGAYTVSQTRAPDSEQVKQSVTSPQRRSRSSARTGGIKQLSTRDIYRRGYLAGYRAAYRRFRGESRSTNLPSGPDRFSLTSQFITESAMAGGNVSVLRLLPSIKLSDEFSIGAQLGAKVTFGNEDPASNATSAEDGKLIFKYSGFQLGKVVKYSTSLEVALPISEASREEKTLITGLTPIPRLDFDWSSLGANGLTSYFKLSLTRNFHSSETTRTDSPAQNMRYSVIPKGGIAYSIAPVVGIEVGFGREFYWGYDGEDVHKYEFYQELGFSLSKSLSLALGHYTYNTMSDTVGVEFASKQASNVYGVMSYSF